MPDAIVVSAATNKARLDFFAQVIGEAKGWLCVAAMPYKGMVLEEYYQWPDQQDAVVEWINRSYQANNVYFCPTLLTERKRNKDNVVDTVYCAWADLDTAHPSVMHPEPSVRVETSAGRWQGYWLLQPGVDKEVAETISHRLALGHREYGVDQSGWDLSQLLRVPLTHNHKYQPARIVGMPEYAGIAYDTGDFDHLPEITARNIVDVDMPDISDLNRDVILKKFALLVPESTRYTLVANVAHPDRSKILWATEIALFESGMGRAEVFAVVKDSAIDKFTQDGRPEAELWKDVLRAEAYVIENSEVPLLPESAMSPVISEAERSHVESLPPSFVERYVEWASGRSDAVRDYHLASALISLSAVVSGSVRIPTKAEEFKLNLWCLILADSTITRKSTAMKYAEGILYAVDDTVIAATDASAEGLLEELSHREGKASMFFRDEVSGLFASFRKEYMSGMSSTLSHLYDGTNQKRVLRKGTIEVKDPVFIFYGGGVTQRIFQYTDEDFVTDGFFPRFMFFVGESDMRNFEALGPPTIDTDHGRIALVQELEDIRQRYDLRLTIHVGGAAQTGNRLPYRARLSPQAWERWQKVERQFMDEALRSTTPHLHSPMLARLSINLLKVATLIACARQDPRTNPEHEVAVEIDDVLKALALGDMLRSNALYVLRNCGRTTTERRLEEIMEYMMKHDGCVLGALMRHFRFLAKETQELLDTLELRGLLRREHLKAGGWRLHLTELSGRKLPRKVQ